MKTLESLPRCSHRQIDTDKPGTMACGLLPHNMIVALSPNPNCPCWSCYAEWPGGVQPTDKKHLPPILTRITSQALAQNRNDSGPVQSPENCHHGGVAIDRHAIPCRRVYACDLHGQATCGESRPGVMRCGECGDFAAIRPPA